MAKSKQETLYSAKTLNNSSADNSASMDVSMYKEASILLAISGRSGSSPTLDLDVDVSHDASTWVKHTDVAQITADGNALVKLTGNLMNWIRLSPTIGGTSTPTYVITATAVAKEN